MLPSWRIACRVMPRRFVDTISPMADAKDVIGWWETAETLPVDPCSYG